MNVEGSAVEQALGRAIMPRCHAGFSAGTVAAARVSVVATIGYAAFLAGPPLIGFLGERAETLHALAVTGGLVALGLMIFGVPRLAAAIDRSRASAAAACTRDGPTRRRSDGSGGGAGAGR